MFSKQKNVSLNSIPSAQFDEFKISRKKIKNLPKTGEIAEVFFLCMRFQLMRQSELKVRANKQFLLVDNDAQRIRRRFLNHSTVVIQDYRKNENAASHSGATTFNLNYTLHASSVCGGIIKIQCRF